MIWESGPWKDELKKISQTLFTLDIEDENFTIEFEKNVFLASYIIIKLIRSFKFSDEFREELYQIETYPYFDEDDFDDLPEGYITLTHMNDYNWEKYYNFDKPTIEKRRADFICNQINHSYVFVYEEYENRTNKGFYFNSDKTKMKFVFKIALTEFQRLIKLAATDDIVSFCGHKDMETGEWIIKNSRFHNVKRISS